MRKNRFYPFIYISYWHYIIHKNKNHQNSISYFTARPNNGAGTGHQMANWIAGYWFAKQFKLKFAHIPFPNSKWEEFLGFGEGEVKISDLLNNGYKTRKLPLFTSDNTKEVDLTISIIKSYLGKKMIFVAEQDQFYPEQIGVIEEIKKKFYTSTARMKDKLSYSDQFFNIAIHIRRGDIQKGQESKNPNLTMRWLNNRYYEKILNKILVTLKQTKPIAIYIFSEGTDKEFKGYQNMQLCLGMPEMDSFLHLVSADLLITSKSSFSYKPALLSNGIKICPRNFWHSYPRSNEWILVDDDGTFDSRALKTVN
jgi:hypothetical protein